MTKITNITESAKALPLILSITITIWVFFKKSILDMSLVKAIKYRDRKLSKIISESFREDLHLLLRKYPQDTNSLETLKKQLISKKTHFDYLDIKKSNKFGNQKREMIAGNIKILKKLIDLIEVIQRPLIGPITSTENEINLLKKLVSANSQGHSHLYTIIYLNKKFDNKEHLECYEFRSIYRQYISGGKPFPLN